MGASRFSGGRSLVLLVLGACGLGGAGSFAACSSSDDGSTSGPSSDAATDGTVVGDAGSFDASLFDGGQPGDDDASPTLDAGDAASDGSSCSSDTATDPSNCGACGYACGAGTCAGSICQPVQVSAATFPSEIDGIALTADQVYWTDYHTGTVTACNVAGCDAGTAQLYADASTPTEGIVTDSTSVYWTRWEGDDRIGHLFKCALSGCTSPIELWSSATEERPNVVAVTNTAAIFGGPDTLFTCPLGGCPSGGATTFASGLSRAYQQPIVVGSDLWWFTDSNMTNGDGALLKCPTSGCPSGAATTVLGGLNITASGLGSDGSGVYWAEYYSDRIQRCALPDCAGGPTTLVSGQPKPQALAMPPAGDVAYWSVQPEAGPGEIRACTLPSCTNVRTVLSGVTLEFALTVDATHFAYAAGGNVFVARRPFGL